MMTKKKWMQRREWSTDARASIDEMNRSGGVDFGVMEEGREAIQKKTFGRLNEAMPRSIINTKLSYRGLRDNRDDEMLLEDMKRRPWRKDHTYWSKLIKTAQSEPTHLYKVRIDLRSHLSSYLISF